MPLAAMAGATIGGSIISGLFGQSAASTQADAATQAAQLQAQEQDKALAFNQQVFNQDQANAAPYLQAGGKALSSLQGLLAPGGALTQQFGQFQAPTAQQAAQQPGYQFALQQGEQALQASAAAQGGLLTGGMAKALTNYGQQAGQQDYQQVYNNALNAYQSNFNTFNQNQANQFNRYASLAGIGQTQAGQLGSQAGGAASNNTSALLTGGAQIGQDVQNAAYQTGSGYAALGNAIGGGVSNLGTLLSLKSLLSPGAGISPDQNFGQSAPAATGPTLAQLGIGG